MESKHHVYQQSYAYVPPTPPVARQPTDFKRYSHMSPSEWLLESLTLIMSVLFFGAIVALLWLMNGRALDEWTPSISLNAVISILSTACATALMHGVGESISQHKWLYFITAPRRLDTFKKIDQASRGTSGAAKLVLGTKWNLATLGAIISIARLAFSPLVQQVIQIDQRVITRPANDVTYGFAHEYNRPNLLDGLAFVDQRTVPQDAQMQAAILQGLFNISTPAVFSCPGACTWSDRTVSLGFTTDCSDVTKDTLASESCSDTEDDAGVVETECVMETPNSVKLATRALLTAYGTSYVMNATKPDPVPETNLPEGFPTFVHLAAYRADIDGNFQPVDPSITQCSLSFAAFEYSGAQANGSDFRFSDPKKIDLSNGVSWDMTGDVELVYHSNSAADKDLPKLTISLNDIWALQHYFTSSSIVSRWIDGTDRNQDLGVSAALKGKVDIGERFERMATSMTDYLRSGPNLQLAEGSKLENVAFVTVQWYWLAGPAAIELGAVLFVLITMIANRSSRKVPLWKSSIVAALNCNIDEVNGMLKPKEGDLKGLEKRTEKTFARLE